MIGGTYTALLSQARGRSGCLRSAHRLDRRALRRVRQALSPRAPRPLSVDLYLALGWSALIALKPLVASLPPETLAFVAWRRALFGRRRVSSVGKPQVPERDLARLRHRRRRLPVRRRVAGGRALRRGPDPCRAAEFKTGVRALRQSRAKDPTRANPSSQLRVDVSARRTPVRGLGGPLGAGADVLPLPADRERRRAHPRRQRARRGGCRRPEAARLPVQRVDAPAARGLGDGAAAGRGSGLQRRRRAPHRADPSRPRSRGRPRRLSRREGACLRARTQGGARTRRALRAQPLPRCASLPAWRNGRRSNGGRRGLVRL